MPATCWMLMALLSAACLSYSGPSVGLWDLLWTVMFGYFFFGAMFDAKRRGFVLAMRRFSEISQDHGGRKSPAIRALLRRTRRRFL